MELMERDWREGVSRFDALVVGASGEDVRDDAAAAVEAAGGRVIASVGWHDALARVGTIASRAVILLDARNVPDERLAATLSPLDGLAAGRDLSMIVGIDEAQIDIAAAGLNLSSHEILCAPQPSDWVAALAVAHLPGRLALHDRVGDSESARLASLNAEVARITSVLARLSQREDAPQPNAVSDRTFGYAVEPGAAPAIAPADIRQIVRARRLRDRHLGEGLFEDPAWDMILDLFAAHLERAQVSVSSLCIAAAVAPTTALRWIARLTEAGLFERRPDPFDRRRAFMSLSGTGLAAMHRYVTTVRALGLPLV